VDGREERSEKDGEKIDLDPETGKNTTNTTKKKRENEKRVHLI
jgi:hypothetical protein